jgi:hypothetical protein
MPGSGLVDAGRPHGRNPEELELWSPRAERARDGSIRGHEALKRDGSTLSGTGPGRRLRHVQNNVRILCADRRLRKHSSRIWDDRLGLRATRRAGLELANPRLTVHTGVSSRTLFAGLASLRTECCAVIGSKSFAVCSRQTRVHLHDSREECNRYPEGRRRRCAVLCHPP